MLQITDLRKSFYKKEILKNVSCSFEKGQIYCILGGNGSGRTTLLQCISNDLKYEEGSIAMEEGKNAMLAQKHGLLPVYLTGYQFLNFLLKETEETSEEEAEKTSEEGAEKTSEEEAEKTSEPETEKTSEVDLIFDRVNVDEEARHLLIKEYDFAMKKKLQLAAFLIQKPYVMIFDEPFDYCDEAYMDEFVAVLDAIKENHILIVSTGLIDIAKKIPGSTFLLSKGEVRMLSKETLENKSDAKKLLELLGEAEDE